MAVDELVTLMTLNAGRYTTGAARVVTATNAIGASQHKTSAISTNFTSRMVGGMSSIVKAAGPALAIVSTGVVTLAGAFGGLAASAIAMSTATVGAFAEFDSLNKSLLAVEGSAEGASRQLKALIALAEKPGIGDLMKAQEGFLMLRNSGLDTRTSNTMLEVFGMSNARVGGDSANLSRILLALSQILNTPNLQGDELRQLQEARLPIMSIMMKRFGTSRSEELLERGVSSRQVVAAIVEELALMPPVAKSARNELEALKNQAFLAQAAIGGGIWSFIGDQVREFGTTLALLNSAGVFRSFGEHLGFALKNIVGSSDGLNDAMVSLTAAAFTAVDGLMGFQYGLSLIVDWIRKHFPGVRMAENMLSGSGNALGDRFQFHKSEIRRKLEEERAKSGTGAGSTSLDEFIDKAVAVLLAGSGKPTKAEKHLEAIERYTGTMANVFDQSAFGGGDIIRQGVSIHNQRTFNRSAATSSNAALNWERTVRQIAAALQLQMANG